MCKYQKWHKHEHDRRVQEAAVLGPIDYVFSDNPS